jgi:hypothetical protein
MVDRMRLIASRVQENVLICAFEGSRLGFLELPCLRVSIGPSAQLKKVFLGLDLGRKRSMCVDVRMR